MLEPDSLKLPPNVNFIYRTQHAEELPKNIAMLAELNPVFKINIHFDKLYHIDAVRTGLYKIRFKIKSTKLYKPQIQSENSGSSNAVMPSAVLLPDTAITKTVEYMFAEEPLDINDRFDCTVEVTKRIDHITDLRVPMIFQLLFLERDKRPRQESFTVVCERKIDLILSLNHTLHFHRPVLFGYSGFSALTFTVHAALTSILTNRKQFSTKSAPRVREYYKCLCNSTFSTLRSLEMFYDRYQHLLLRPFAMSSIDVDAQVESHLNNFEHNKDSWKQIERDAHRFSKKLTQSFSRMIEVLSRSQMKLTSGLLEEFNLWRMKNLGEAFFIIEDNSLINDTSQHSVSRIIELLKKKPYYSWIPRSKYHVHDNDMNKSNTSVIIERRYIASRHPFENNGVLDVTNRGNINSFIRSCSGSSQVYMVSHTEDLPSPNFRSRRRSQSLTNPRKWNKDPWILSVKKERKAKSETNIANVKSNFFYNLSEQYSIAGLSSTFTVDAVTANDYGFTINSSRAFIDDSVNDLSSITGSEFSFMNASLRLNEQRIDFVNRKESFKSKLHQCGRQPILYSDFASFPGHESYFSTQEYRSGHMHLIVFVHGLQGTLEDLSEYRVYLRLLLPSSNLKFLISKSNIQETWSDINILATNLLEEVLDYLGNCSEKPKRISFIAHSMGGVIVRRMIIKRQAAPIVPLLHAFLTLNSPHCGLLYNERAANWGISLVQWWKQSASMCQLTLRDAASLRNTLLYKLSRHGTFSKFKYVLLLGTYHDILVPHHSAVIEISKTIQKDTRIEGRIYEEMVRNINESIINSKETMLFKYTVVPSMADASRTSRIIGRAAHIAILDDVLLIEKFLALSACHPFK